MKKINCSLLLFLALFPLLLTAQEHPAALVFSEALDGAQLGMSMASFQKARPQLKPDGNSFRTEFQQIYNRDGLTSATYYFDNDSGNPLYEIIVKFDDMATRKAVIDDGLGTPNYPGKDDHWVIYNGGAGNTVIAWVFSNSFVMATDIAKSEWEGDPLFVLPDNFPKGDPNAPVQMEEDPPAVYVPQQAATENSIELVFPETHYAEAVAYTPDEQMLLSAGYGELKFWETGGGRLLKTLPFVLEQQTGFRNTNNLCVSPNGSMAALCEQEQVFLFDIDALGLTNIFLQDMGLWLEQAIFSNDNRYLYVAGRMENAFENYFIKKIEIATGNTTTVHEWKEPYNGSHNVSHLALSADGGQLIVYDALAGSRLINLKTNKLVKNFKESPCLYAFLPNGNFLAVTGVASKKFNLEEISSSTWKTVGQPKTLFIEEEVEPQWSTFIASNEKGKMLIYNESEYYRFDLNTFKLSQKLQLPDTEIGMMNAANLCISPGGKSFVQGLNMSRYDYDSGKFRQEFGVMPYRSGDLTRLPNGSGIMLNDRMMGFDQNGFTVRRFTPPGSDPEAFRCWRFNEKGTGGFVFVDGDGLYSFDYDRIPKNFEQIDLGGKNDFRGMRFFDKKGMLGLVFSNGAILIDINKMELVQAFPVDSETTFDIFETDEDYYCDLSPDGSTFVFIGSAMSWNDLLCYEVNTGKQKWVRPCESETVENLRFMPNGKTIAFTRQGDELHVVNTKDGEEAEMLNMQPQTDWYTTISPSGMIAATRPSSDEGGALGRSVVLYYLNKEEIYGSLEGHKEMVWNVLFLNEQSHLMTQAENFKIWTTEEQPNDLDYHETCLATITLFNDTDDWLVTTPDGRFDASPGAMERMYYVKNGVQIIPLEALYEGFYTPNLLTQIMNGEKSAPAVDINDIKSPPTVKINYNGTSQRNLEVEDEHDAPSFNVTTATVSVQVQASCNDAAVAEIRLFHNGKLIENSTRNLSVEDDTPGGDALTKSFTINLIAGENRLRAVAINSQRTESQPDEIVLNYKPAAPPSGGSGGVTLHLVVVGINNYKNQKYNLNYAVADATGFKDAMSKNCGKIVSNCQQYFITNENAMKGNIVAELNKVVASAKPQDVFVMYYAGHGVVAEDAGKEFYLVPHDVTQLYGNDGALAQKGLSAKELREFSQKIKAQKQLFILDACQSSGALGTVAARGAAEEKAIAQLARSTGTHWLTAAGSEQFASEFTQLGHGVFTYALLKGLGGAADTGDGKVTVKELDAYLQEQVPELTQKYKGTPQYPASYGFGQDFPLSVK